MTKLQSQLKTVSKSLAALSKQVEKLSQQVSNDQPAKTAVAARTTPIKKNKAAGAVVKTVLDTVYDAIRRTQKGVTVEQLKQKTKLNARQLSNALYKLSKKGLVQTKSRGVYIKK